MGGLLFILFVAMALAVVWLYQYFRGLIRRSGWFLKHGFENYYAEIKKALLPYMNCEYIARKFGKDFLEVQARMCKSYSDQISSGSVSPWVSGLYERRTDHDFVEAYAMRIILGGVINCKEKLWPSWSKKDIFIPAVRKSFDDLENSMREKLMKKLEEHPSLQDNFYLDVNFVLKERQYKTKQN